MAWTVSYDPRAVKELAALDQPVAKRILDYMDLLASLDDLTPSGKALTGALSGSWHYRVDDWRVICDLAEGHLVVLVLDPSHRSKAYVQER